MRGIEELSELLKSDEINSLGKDLGKRIQDKLERSGIYFHIFARVKEAGSIWHKLEWKKEEYLQRIKRCRTLWEFELYYIIWMILQSAKKC